MWSELMAAAGSGMEEIVNSSDREEKEWVEDCLQLFLMEIIEEMNLVTVL